MSKRYNKYKYTTEDKSWKREGGKTGSKFIRTEKDMCERHPDNVYTKGKNEEYPGCENGWCCGLIKSAQEQTVEAPIELSPSSPIGQGQEQAVTLSTKKYSGELVSSPNKSQRGYNNLTFKEMETLVFGSDEDDDEPIPFNELFIDNLQKLETILKSQGDHFRAKAYRNAKESIISYGTDIYSTTEIKSLPNIGPSIYKKLEELVNTGNISVIEKHKNQPEQLFTKIFGIGPKKASELHIDNGIKTVDELKKNTHLLNSKQKIGLRYYDDLLLRIPRNEIDEYNIILEELFNKVKDKNSIFKILGSYRRGAASSGDIDIIISDPEDNIAVFNKFLEILKKEGLLIEILSRGHIKCLGISKLGSYPPRRMDFMFSFREQLSFATLYFTGSQAFNIAMRTRALEYGVTMNEHDFTISKKHTLKKPLPLSFPTEESVFQYLDLEYKHPIERINVNSLVEKIHRVNPTKKFVIKPKPIPIPPLTPTPTPTPIPIPIPTPITKPASLTPKKFIKKKVNSCISGNTGQVVFNKPVLLAKEYKNKDWSNAVDPTGWWVSEKFDGYRAIWNGKEFVSRQNNVYHVPDWFSALMPPSISLDGELWMGRERFQKCGLFKKKTPITKDWINAQVIYKVFDLPSSTKHFEDRMIDLQKIVRERCECMLELKIPGEIIKIRCPLMLTEHTKVESAKHLDLIFTEVVENGGEGVMIRKPKSLYENKRSNTLLKYKQLYDTECKIIGFKMGTGKYTGLLGSFKCQLIEGIKKDFYVSGMTDDVRRNYLTTHPIGTIITINYNETTENGIPRHPRYLRIRDDCAL